MTLFKTLPYILIICEVILWSCNNPKKGGENGLDTKNQYLKVNLRENVTSILSSSVKNDSDKFLVKQVYETLYSLDQGEDPVPLLASKLTIDTLSNTYEITLKKNVKFSNGDFLTTEDVYNSFKDVFSKKRVTASINRFRNNIVGFESDKAQEKLSDVSKVPTGFRIIDKRRFTIKMKRIDPMFLHHISDIGLSIYKRIKSKHIVGTGPFAIDFANEDIYINLRRNSFHKSSLNDKLISGINIRFIKNEEALINEFANGSIDVIYYDQSKGHNFQLNNLVKMKYSYQSSIEQKSSLAKYITFHNFRSEKDIIVLLNALETNVLPRLIFKDQLADDTKIMNYKDSSLLKSSPKMFISDSVLNRTIPIINNSKTDQAGFIRSMNSNMIELTNIVHHSYDTLNPKSEYIVIREARVDMPNGKPNDTNLMSLARKEFEDNTSVGLTIVDYKHDYVIFDERIEGFNRYGDWTSDVSKLSFIETKVF